MNWEDSKGHQSCFRAFEQGFQSRGSFLRHFLFGSLKVVMGGGIGCFGLQRAPTLAFQEQVTVSAFMPIEVMVVPEFYRRQFGDQLDSVKHPDVAGGTGAAKCLRWDTDE
jgi:hypothetical protein